MKNNSPVTSIAAAFILLISLSGCYESAFPLDPTPQSPLDEKLMDGWRCLPTESAATSAAATLTISTARPQVYRYVFQADDELPESYEAYTSLVNNQPVLNIQEDQEPGTWVFGRYQWLRPDILHFQIVDADVLDGKYDTPDALRQALEQKLVDAKLFSDLMTCVRITN